MVYHAIGIMSGSSLDGLDMVFASFQEQAGQWDYEIKNTACYSYTPELAERLKSAIHLDAREYQLLHTSFGHHIGSQVNKFIEENKLEYKVSLVSSHGHTTFHMPEQKMTAQLGDGAAIASEIQLPVVTDLRAMDIAFGGQGAPIVPVGEKFLLRDYDFYLNLGGIANVSFNDPEKYVAFDICAANRVLNMLINSIGKAYDDGGRIAATGQLDTVVFETLNELDYYTKPFPKSLANDFGTDIVYPLITNSELPLADALRTYTEHIAFQISQAIAGLKNQKPETRNHKLLATGGGAFNQFLVQRISEMLAEHNVEVIVPDEKLVNYKEALIMAFMGILRWRQEYNVLSSVTGASRNSIGGALWTGAE